MLDNAFLKRKTIMDRCCCSLLEPWIKNDCCWATTREGCKYRSFANVDCGDLELFEHELGQLHSSLFVMICRLSKNKRCLSRIDHQLIYQTLPQNVLKVIKVDYKSYSTVSYLFQAPERVAVSPYGLSWSWVQQRRQLCDGHLPSSCHHLPEPNLQFRLLMGSHSLGNPLHCTLFNKKWDFNASKCLPETYLL